MENIIEVKDLVKKYDRFKLDIPNLVVPKGTIVGLIGENGAGKTTLIKSLLNIINIDSGKIELFKQNYKEINNEKIGVVLDDMFFPEILTPQDLEIILKDIYKKWDSKLYNDYLKEFDLPKKKIIKELSKGMRKKLEIATALAHHPDLLILDEPTSGLDPVVRNEILDIFLNFIQDENKGILLSTHITSDLEHVADKIIFIDQGKILLDEVRDDILDNYAIIKCNEEDYQKIDSNDVIAFKKYKYNYDVLVKDRKKMQKKYKDLVIDKITLEELMVLMIKGGK